MPESYEGSYATIAYNALDPSKSDVTSSMFTMGKTPINTFTAGVAALTKSVTNDYFLIENASKVECAKDAAGAVTSCSFKYHFKRDFNSATVPLTPGKVDPFEVYAFYELKTTT